MSEKEPSDFFIESAITGATPQLPWPIGGQPDPNDFKDLKELAQDLWVTLSTDQHQYFQDLVFEGFDQFWFEYKKLMYHNKPAKASNPKKDDKAPKKKAGRKKTQLHYLAPLPTDMTRVSPFFPGGHNCKKAGIRFDEPIIIKNSWGIATYQGPQLTMAHEDLLLAILAALCKTNRRVLDNDDDSLAHKNTCTYTYNGSLRAILRAKGNQSPNSDDYKTAYGYLEDMANAVLSIQTTTNCEQVLASLITSWDRAANDGKNDTFRVTVNSYFLLMHNKKRVTWLNMLLHNKIRSPYGKAIHRFIAGQRDKSWTAKLSIFSAAINLHENLKNYEIKEKLDPAIKELVKLGILEKNTKIEDNIIKLYRGKILNIKFDLE